MLSRSKAKRAVMAAVVAAAVGASGAATADAATVTRTDDTAADFTAGTPNGTIVRGTDAAAGVEIAPTLESVFNGAGPGLPTGWASDAVGRGRRRDGRRRHADRRRRTRRQRRDRRSRELGRVHRATLGAEPFRHVGFAGNFDDRPVGDLQHRRRRAGARAVGQGCPTARPARRTSTSTFADAADRHARVPDRLVGDRLRPSSSMARRSRPSRSCSPARCRPAGATSTSAPAVSRSTSATLNARGRPARSCHACSTRVIRR